LGGVGALCLAAATFGRSLDAVSGFAAAVWPPTGIALAALILYGSGLWPAIAIGAFLVNWWVGAPVLVAAGMALGNTLEAVVGAVVLERAVGFRPSLARLQDVLGPTGRNLRSRIMCSICLSEKGCHQCDQGCFMGETAREMHRIPPRLISWSASKTH
jgi:integral membrane sensor domain MASE1